MQSFEVTLPKPKRDEYVELAVMCCLHFGHKACDRQKAKSWRDFVLAGENRYAINLGDDMENAIPGDEAHNSMIWDSDKQPDEQYAEACDFWAPLAEAGKLVITHDSNHHWRSEAKTGISRAKDINVFLQNLTAKKVAHNPRSDRLPRWGRWQAITRVIVGGLSYDVHTWHGVGSGCTPEAALRKCRSMAVQHRADIYLMGHAHNKIVWQDQYMIPAGNGAKAIERERTFGVTGGYLGWHDSYAERTGLPPNKRGSILLRLNARRWDVKISL